MDAVVIRRRRHRKDRSPKPFVMVDLLAVLVPCADEVRVHVGGSPSLIVPLSVHNVWKRSAGRQDTAGTFERNKIGCGCM